MSKKIHSSQKNVMKKLFLTQIRMLSSQGKFLIALDQRWKYFFIGDPTFEAIIENGRLNLYGPKVNLNPHRDHLTAETGGNHE